MKKNRMYAWMRLSRVVCTVLAVMGMCCIGSALAASAEGRMEVLLWPSGGRIQVVEELPVRDGSVTFVLPAGAQLGSLSLSVDGGTVVNRETEPVDSSNPALMGLKTALQEARTQVAVVEGELATAKARITLWSAGYGDTSVEDKQKLDAAMGAHLSELYVQIAALEPRRTETLRKVELLERELASKGDRLEVTRVTAQILLPDAKDASGERTATIRYSCTLTGCSWKPVYRLDAFPDKELVQFVQEAEIMQSTGQDWNGVTLTLASGEPGDALMPNPLRDWRLQPFQRPRPQQRSVQMMEAKSMMANDAMPMASAVVAMEEQSTFTSWDLGTQTVRAGVPVRLGLGSGDWKATFVRVARPSTDSHRTTGESARQATWLMANVTLPEAQDYPSGMAQFAVDGRPVGTEQFSFVGDEKTLFFGRDARVTTEMKLDARQSGSKGFVDKQQTRIWSWNIDVHNSHSTPVLVRVEDPEPQSGDETIKLKVTSTPKPVIEDHTYIWNLTVPAGGTSTIAHTVEASAPKEMQLDEGR